MERLQPERYGHRETVSTRWFGPMAKKAMAESEWKDFFAGFGTLQGVYVAGPDGTPYAYTNIHYPTEADYPKVRERFLAWMDAALRKARASPPARVEVSAEEIRGGAPDPVPPATSVVRVFGRLRMADAAHPANRGVGRDHFWIFADEVRGLLQGGEAPRLPPALLARLVRFQLLDHTRNVGVPYGEKDVRKADFALRVLRKEGGVTTLALSGDFAAERHDADSGEKVGIEGTLRGEIDLDASKALVVRFRAFGEATGWGDVKRTCAPEGKYPMVFAFVEATDELSRAIPPVWHGLSPVWEPIYRKPALGLRPPRE